MQKTQVEPRRHWRESRSRTLVFHFLSSVQCPRMRICLVGTVNSLNIEHPTPNIQRPILMSLRFIYFKTSESR
jgi:hypothetical protein